MFVELFKRMADGDTVTIAITKKDALLTVSVLPTKQLKNVKPLIIKSGAAELDAGFIDAIDKIVTTVSEKVTALTIENEDDVKQSIDDAKNNTTVKSKTGSKKTATEKAPAEPKTSEVKLTLYETLCKDVQPFIDAKNWQEAISKINARIPSLKGADLKSAKELLFNTQLAKQKSMFDTDDEADESKKVVIPKATPKMQPNPNVIADKAVAVEMPEEEEEEIPVVEDEEEQTDDF